MGGSPPPGDILRLIGGYMDKQIRLYDDTSRFLDYFKEVRKMTDCILLSMYVVKMTALDSLLEDIRTGGLIPLALLADRACTEGPPYRILLKRGRY